jgi:enolase
MPVILRVSAREILDSRGRPTLKTTCALTCGATASVSVPSGASTGTAEARELRDGEPRRYRGLGCRRAAAIVNSELNRNLAGRDFADQAALDHALLELDGTPDKSRLGANALLSVSLAFARACAEEQVMPLYEQFAAILGHPVRTLPRPTINLFSGGRHAGGQVAIQDVLIVPAAARTMDEALAVSFEVYQCAAELCQRQYAMRALTADEGGLAPPFPNAESMIADAVAAIEAAGFVAGPDVALAVDVASSHFFADGRYHLDGRALTSDEMIAHVLGWLDRFPIVSLEDALAEDEWEAWPRLRERVAGRALVLGDDFLCTNPERIREAVETRAADALLLKVNQIGLLTEAAEACRLARTADWKVTVSARSGETEDDWLADLAVGWAGDQIKVGSLTQSERLAKYNRLLEIEAETRLPLVNWPHPD